MFSQSNLTFHLLVSQPLLLTSQCIQEHKKMREGARGCQAYTLQSLFSFDACFKMDNDAGTRTGLRLHYTIEEQPYQDRPLPRVRFADSTPNEPSEVHRNITLRPEDMGRFRCSKEIVYLLVRNLVVLCIA
ncbi:hypothetical protein E2C01_028449 [Portunus trituberculatus]|uniref:Uncharacterized protein n=1 Tax=Portunus trituberculatus TaxID=210409 RepID=A0A5B7EKG7_PORTR|nr:hypothetical protein [Portunus trituberculatus]